MVFNRTMSDGEHRVVTVVCRFNRFLPLHAERVVNALTVSGTVAIVATSASPGSQDATSTQRRHRTGGASLSDRYCPNGATALRQAIKAPSVLARFQHACEEMTRHIHQHHEVIVTEMLVNFRVDGHDDRLKLLWCDHLVVSPAAGSSIEARITHTGATVAAAPMATVASCGGVPSSWLTWGANDAAMTESAARYPSSATWSHADRRSVENPQKTSQAQPAVQQCPVCRDAAGSLAELPRVQRRYLLLSLSLLDHSMRGWTEAGVPPSVCLMDPGMSAAELFLRCGNSGGANSGAESLAPEVASRHWLDEFVAVCRACVERCNRAVDVLTRDRVPAPAWLQLDDRFFPGAKGAGGAKRAALPEGSVSRDSQRGGPGQSSLQIFRVARLWRHLGQQNAEERRSRLTTRSPEAEIRAKRAQSKLQLVKPYLGFDPASADDPQAADVYDVRDARRWRKYGFGVPKDGFAAKMAPKARQPVYHLDWTSTVERLALVERMSDAERAARRQPTGSSPCTPEVTPR